MERCQWFSLGTPVSSTNKIEGHNVAEILLKVALSTITLDPYVEWSGFFYFAEVVCIINNYIKIITDISTIF